MNEWVKNRNGKKTSNVRIQALYVKNHMAWHFNKISKPNLCTIQAIIARSANEPVATGCQCFSVCIAKISGIFLAHLWPPSVYICHRVLLPLLDVLFLFFVFVLFIMYYDSVR